MSLLIFDFAVNGVTPGAINPEIPGTATTAFNLLSEQSNKSRSLIKTADRIGDLTLHIDWVQATATGVFRVQLGMQGSTSYFTVLEFTAPGDFNTTSDNAIGVTFPSGLFETLRFDGSGVTGGSPIVRLG